MPHEVHTDAWKEWKGKWSIDIPLLSVNSNTNSAIRYSTNENTHTYMYVLHNQYAACVITRRTVFEYAVNFITYYKVKHLIAS